MAPITPMQQYLASLASLVEPAESLEKHGYITRPLSEEDLLGKQRCTGCGKTMSRLSRRRRPPLVEPTRLDPANNQLPAISQPHYPSTPAQMVAEDDEAPTATPQQEPRIHCRFHPGDLINRVWICCNQSPSAPLCSGAYQHSPRSQGLRELIELHQCYPTPWTPPRGNNICEAVALDCEMGTAASGDPELIRVTLVNYFSKTVILDNIVKPDVPMQHLNTRYSGVTWADMKNARKQGTSLKGKAGAREKIWKHVGPHTLVVGHGVNNDLRSLRWIHTLVVDSYVTEFGRVKLKEAEELKLKKAEEQKLKEAEAKTGNLTTLDASKNSEDLKIPDSGTLTTPNDPAATTNEPPRVRKPGNLLLKTLAKKYLDRDIQTQGKKGHDSLEDAIAARDLVHRNVVDLVGRM
ncbi:hypothetical protein CC86DRAFT_442293 [Ophiobolus disseminans]|uniref:Exonuclease domain-containing protein n=1 Tax=Ophiobolus disseminans TaxID=1469910 RepID=A0A6A7AN99_9PLEO|nr:hypothetical protein CC86DRAFT_442293 [Ophiobolus disseminans]